MEVIGMKLYSKITQVSFKWWRNDGKDVPIGDIEHLEEYANVHIQEMREQGYTSGQLTLEVGLDEVQYSGWWDVREDKP